MYRVSVAAKGQTQKLREKEFTSIKSALIAGKRLLANQKAGAVVVYNKNFQQVASSEKNNWKWSDNPQ